MRSARSGSAGFRQFAVWAVVERICWVCGRGRGSQYSCTLASSDMLIKNVLQKAVLYVRSVVLDAVLRIKTIVAIGCLRTRQKAEKVYHWQFKRTLGLPLWSAAWETTEKWRPFTEANSLCWLDRKVWICPRLILESLFSPIAARWPTVISKFSLADLGSHTFPVYQAVELFSFDFFIWRFSCLKSWLKMNCPSFSPNNILGILKIEPPMILNLSFRRFRTVLISANCFFRQLTTN